MHCKLLEKNHNPVLDTVTVARNPFSSRSWHSGLRKPTSRWKLSLSPLSTSLAGALASQFEKISKIQKEKKGMQKIEPSENIRVCVPLTTSGGLGFCQAPALRSGLPSFFFVDVLRPERRDIIVQWRNLMLFNPVRLVGAGVVLMWCLCAGSAGKRCHRTGCGSVAG